MQVFAHSVVSPAPLAPTLLSPADARLIALSATGQIPLAAAKPQLRNILSRIAGKSVVRLTDKDSLVDLAAVALCRADIELESAALRAFGFIDVRDAAPAQFPTRQLLRDYNFDKALDLFVETTCRQGDKSLPSRAELERQFVVDGKLQLLISTKQQNRNLIGLVGNVGDNFGLHVTKYLSRREVLPFGTWVEPERPVMLSVGSYMQHARNRGLVWGTGCIQEMAAQPEVQPTSSIFLGVRGPRTREQLLLKYGINPRVTGDPGILIPDVCRPGPRAPSIKCGFIIHSVDRNVFRETWPDAFLINNTATPEVLAADILRCEYVVSSSLHGVIFSHALGVPCAAVKFGDRLTGGDFKFLDYFQSTGTYSVPGRIDISDSRPLVTSEWISLVEKVPLPATGHLKERLTATFPFSES